MTEIDEMTKLLARILKRHPELHTISLASAADRTKLAHAMATDLLSTHESRRTGRRKIDRLRERMLRF